MVGLNHKSCPRSLLEAFLIPDEDIPYFLEKICEWGLSEAAILSTCDRLEIISFHEQPPEVVEIFLRVLAEYNQRKVDTIQTALYQHSGENALKHLFKVCSSLDSQIIGEPQILGQVRSSYRFAANAGMLGNDLDKVFGAAFSAAKRIRAQTSIGEGPISLISSSLRIAREIHGELSRCNIVVFGAEELAILMATQFKNAGVSNLTILEDHTKRAELANRDLPAMVYGLDKSHKIVEETDIIISSHFSSDKKSITKNMIQNAIQKRHKKPIFIIDLGVPSAVETEVSLINEVFLYNLDDLEQVASTNKSGRFMAALEGEKILNQEISKFITNTKQRNADPLIKDLRIAVESARKRVLKEKPNANNDEATVLLSKRLLHQPSEMIRKMATEGKLDWQTEMLIRSILLGGQNGNGERQ